MTHADARETHFRNNKELTEKQNYELSMTIDERSKTFN